MIPTKPFYASKTILGIAGSGIVYICGLFGLHVADLYPQILDAISKQIDATLTITGLVVAIYGRFQAHKTKVTLSPASSTLGLLLPFLAWGVMASVLLVACSQSTPSPAPTPAPSPTPAPTPAPVAISSADLAIIQTGATIATGAVLNFAVKQADTRVRLANEIYSSANFLYKASGGTPPTPADFAAGLNSYGQPGDVQYAQYTVALQALYSTYYTKYVTNGSVNAQNFAAVLNAFAAGAEAGASTYATIAAPAKVAASSPLLPGWDSGDVNQEQLALWCGWRMRAVRQLALTKN